MQQMFVMYLGLGLVTVATLLILVFGVFGQIKKIKGDSKKWVLIVTGMAIIGVVLVGVGDSIRIDMFKVETLKYYNEGLEYIDLKPRQQENVRSTIFSFNKLLEEEREIYYEASLSYIKQYYEEKGYRGEELDGYVNNWIKMASEPVTD